MEKKKFVKIQSKVSIRVTCGLQFTDVTNPDAHVADRLKVSSDWPRAMQVIEEGVHVYPSEIVEWPSVQALVKDEVEYAVQVNSKIKAKLMIPEGLSDEDIQDTVCAYPEIAELIAGKSVKKCIIVRGRLVNLIVG